MKFAFGKFVENAFGDSWGRAVIEGKGDTVAKSRAAIDEGRVNFTLPPAEQGFRLEYKREWRNQPLLNLGVARSQTAS